MDKQKALNLLKEVNLPSLKASQKRYEDSFQNIPQTDPWLLIKLGGKEFKLEYSFGAVRELFRLTQKNINNGDLKLEDLNDMDLMVTVLLCGLHTHQPELGKEELESHLTMKHRMYYAHCISKAIEVTQPEFDQLEDVIGSLQEIQAKLQEADDSNLPLPEIVPSPISGQAAE